MKTCCEGHLDFQCLQHARDDGLEIVGFGVEDPVKAVRNVQAVVVLKDDDPAFTTSLLCQMCP